MARLVRQTLLKRLVASPKIRTVAIGVTAIAAATAGGFTLLSPGASNAVGGGKRLAIPISNAQIRADLRNGELGLAENGIFEDEQATGGSYVRSQSAGQKAAELQKLENLLRSQHARTLPRASALKAGLRSIRHGVGPWGSCTFYAQNLYVSPPTGRSGVQYEVYAGSVPIPKLCVGTDPAATPFRGRGAIVEGTYNISPPRSFLIRSPFDSPLVIISARGDVMKLRTLSGRRLTFNIVTRKFGT